MFFYLIFPVLLKFQQKKEIAFSWIVVAFFVVSQIFHFWQLHALASSPEPQYSFAYYFPLFHLNEFLVGMLGATLLPKAIKAGIKLPVFVIAIVIALVMNYRASGISLHNGLMAPLFLLLILGLAIKDNGWMKSRVLVFVGDMSYGVYILQFPVHSLFRYFNDLYFHLANATFFYVYLVTLFLVTVIAHYTVEKPLRKVLLRRG